MRIVRTHRLIMCARFEGEPCDSDTLQVLATVFSNVLTQTLDTRYPEEGEFCDLGITQEIDIEVP